MADNMHYSVSDMHSMATNIAASNLFKSGKEQRPLSVAQVMTLLLISNAEGRHPALGVKDYEIISGKPAKKSDSMLRDFLQNGGKVEWHALTDMLASATFSHAQGGSVKIDWDLERVRKAGLIGRDMWTKYRRQMLRARCISEGVRTIFPAATSGLYVTEEVQDMEIPTQAVIESLDILSAKLAEEVNASKDLQATYFANEAVMKRLEAEKPDWHKGMTLLFEQRDAELKKLEG
jgi:hypothetical protein